MKDRVLNKIAVRCPNWVGDTVMATPVLTCLRDAFPRAEITALCRKSSRAILETNPHIDDLWTIDDHGFGNMLSLSHHIRESRFDAAILLPNSIRSALPFALAGVKQRIGFARHGRSFLLTHPVALTPYHAKCHQVTYYLDLLTELGIEGVDDSLQRLVLHPTDEAKQQIDELLKKKDLENKLLVAISPGAAFGSAKCWLPERYAELAAEVKLRYQAEVLLLGSPAEVPLCNEIESLCPVPIYNMCKDVSLAGLIAICERVAIFVANDSGAMHIAAAMGTPLIAIFGATDPSISAPHSENARVLEAIDTCGCNLAPCYKRLCPTDHACMKAVTVPDAVEAVEWHLARARHGRS